MHATLSTSWLQTHLLLLMRPSGATEGRGADPKRTSFKEGPPVFKIDAGSELAPGAQLAWPVASASDRKRSRRQCSVAACTNAGANTRTDCY